MSEERWWRVLDGADVVATLRLRPGAMAKALQAGRAAVIDGLGVEPIDYVVERFDFGKPPQRHR
ncbi:MAG: hypothetical protein ACR2OV_00265 [Hyphomicrobiaceae bacterium]